MKKILAVFVAALMMFGISGLATASAAPIQAHHGTRSGYGTPGYHNVSCPEGYGQTCWRNFANCNSADGSSGGFTVEVWHIASSSGASSKVWWVRVSDAAASHETFEVLDIWETSGGGGTVYWIHKFPFEPDLLNSYTHAHDYYEYFETLTPENSITKWASFSVNPVVKVELDPQLNSPNTVCSVPLNKTDSWPTS